MKCPPFLGSDTAPPGVVATLDLANTDHLNHLAPEADGWAVEGLLVGVDVGALPDQVGLEGADEAGALEELPTGEGEDGCVEVLLAKKSF